MEHHGSDVKIYVGHDRDGKKSILYDEPDTGIYRIRFVSEEELIRIKDTMSDKIEELLNHFIK